MCQNERNPILINLHSLKTIRLIHNNGTLERIDNRIIDLSLIIVYMRFPCLQVTFAISTKLLRLYECLQERNSCTSANKDSKEDKNRSHLVFL